MRATTYHPVQASKEDLKTTCQVLKELSLLNEKVRAAYAVEGLKLATQISSEGLTSSHGEEELASINQVVSDTHYAKTLVDQTLKFVEAILSTCRDMPPEEPANAGSETVDTAEGPDPDLQV